jgi:alkanesulfonate monooxygenase SsuD/methylene tetrahydromethanopterin reductase-like flavin-dependent oxidoreductase (luciferase family)
MLEEIRPLAVGMIPLETRREAILHLARRADELGFDVVSLPETWSYDSTILLADIAGRTRRIRLMTGVLGVWGRSAAQIAMAASTLNMLSGGRFMLGLGSSTRQLTEGLHDIPYQAPYTKIRETLTQVRALLRGDRVPLGKVSQTRPLKLNLPPQKDIPILLAASAPKSIQIAGELCDGWMPFLYPRSRLPEGKELFRDGATIGETSTDGQIINPVVPVVVAEDSAVARQKAGWIVAFYLMMMGPLYRKGLERLGYRMEVETVLKANTGGKPAMVPAAAESLLEQLTIYGTPDQVQPQLDAWYSAGADMPGLMLGPNLENHELDLTLEAFQFSPDN